MFVEINLAGSRRILQRAKVGARDDSPMDVSKAGTSQILKRDKDHFARV